MGFDHRFATFILTKDQRAAIGSVVIESTFCEQCVEEIIWSLSKLKEDQGKHFTHSLQMASRLELLSSLGKPLLHSDKKKRQLTDLISRLKEANNERNVIVHGTWSTQGVGVVQVLMNGPENYPPARALKRKLNSAPTAFSAADIQKTAIRIGALTWELQQFSVAWKRRASPKKSP